eukprot:TRINITY_DN20776_c0_g1_i1.p1 TRINITY_DN20776_c0_g1~~TRINITY_DN20776_c0_g1_i1.p1  ORF type:complete len:231 (-),score=-5.74 TRINITY_DN20776_c0_g1_i1:33-725(-)
MLLCFLMLVPALNCQISCPAFSPCVGCSECTNSKSPWACVNVSPGYHYADDEIGLVEYGYKGLTNERKFSYTIVFHNNTITYPCSTGCSNLNKLFGSSRGFIPVMDMSCMFAWRQHYRPDDPKDKIGIWAYGWKNASYIPWHHERQTPFMTWIDIDKPYVFSLEESEDRCFYTVSSTSGELLAKNYTIQEPFAYGPSYYFVLFFGGTETTTAPVTVSYNKDVMVLSLIHI